jgi:hypothetical protein
MNRLMKIRIASVLICLVLRKGWVAFLVDKGALPEDAVLVHAESNGMALILTFQSESFEEVAEGGVPPFRMITLKHPEPERGRGFDA